MTTTISSDEPDDEIEQEADELINSFLTMEKSIELTPQSSFVLCPACSFPMFSTEDNDLSRITYMVESPFHSAVWSTRGGLTQGNCPSCGVSFTYQNGYLTSHIQSQAILPTQTTDTSSQM